MVFIDSNPNFGYIDKKKKSSGGFITQNVVNFPKKCDFKLQTKLETPPRKMVQLT